MLEELIIQVLKEDSRFSDLYLGEHGNIYDLVITPLVKFIEEYTEQIIIGAEIDNLDISNYRSMNRNALLRLARTSLANIPDSVASRGEIFLYFSEPVTWAIEEGTIVSGAGAEFRVSDGYFLDKNRTSYVLEDGLHRAQVPLRIINNYGISIEANSLGSIDNAPSELVKITHGEIRSGLDKYTPEMIYQIIKGANFSRQFLSHSSIYHNLITGVPSIKRVETVGADDTLMKRDIIYNVTDKIQEYKQISDFSGRIRGWDRAGDLKVYNGNKAYPVIASDVELYINSDRQEVNQHMYLRLLPYNTEDLVEITTSNILFEDFSASSEVGDITRLIVSDAGVNDKDIDVEDADGFDIGMMVKIVGDRPVYNLINDIEYDSGNAIFMIALSQNLNTEVTNNISTITSIETPGYYIGNNWLKGEHMMTLGRVPNESTIMIINNTLVIGNTRIMEGKNIMKDAIMAVGYNKIMESIYRSLRIDFIKTDQLIVERPIPGRAITPPSKQVIPILSGGDSYDNV